MQQIFYCDVKGRFSISPGYRNTIYGNEPLIKYARIAFDQKNIHNHSVLLRIYAQLE
jgi:hypothetical protein